MEENILYNKWDDAEFVEMLQRRADALENGTDKGYTLEEMKERARSMKLKNRYTHTLS